MSVQRYWAWCRWRARQALTRSWKTPVALGALCVFLLAAQLSIHTLSSPQAMSDVLDWMRPDPVAVSSGTDRSQSEITPPVANAPQVLQDPLAAAPQEDLRQALADYHQRPDWLSSLESTALSTPGVRVYVSDPQQLTDRQRRLMEIQGMILLPWSTPGSDDRLTAVPEYWVQRQSNEWIIHTRAVDISAHSGPGALIVLRAILWVDALDALERWEQSHPAPTPPPELQPSGVSTQLIPSASSNVMMATSATWVLVLALMSLWAIMQMSSWGTLRALGTWLPLAGLTHHTFGLLLSQLVLICLPLVGLTLLSGLISWGVMWQLGYAIDGSWVAYICASLFSGLMLCHGIAVLLQVWPYSRESRQWLGGAWVLALAGLNLWVATTWASLRPLAAFLSSGWALIAVCVFSVGLCVGILWLCAHRLDQGARSGYMSS